MKSGNPWAGYQHDRGVPTIQQTALVKRPNGEVVEINRFDFNIAFAAGTDRYVQCEDQSWIRVGNLTPCTEQEQQLFIAAK